MKGIICSLTLLAVGIFFTSSTYISQSSSAPEVFSCDRCDFVVRGYNTDGLKLKVKPGQIICFDAQATYNTVLLKNIKGTRLEPVIIRNCGGVATIREGLRVAASENFKIIGDGSEERYGIKVSTHKSFYVIFQEFTTDFEVTRMEVAGYNDKGLGEDSGFAGIGIKTSPYENCELFSDSTRTAWVMRNVLVHNNYIHDVGGEGLYIGHGFYKGRVEAKCTVKTYAHPIKGLRVHDNIVEDTGYDGIQIKNADEDCEIYNNVIRNFGNKKHNAHNEGLLIGEGVTGKVYNNFIDTGTGHGIQFQGMGNNEIYNNVILNAGMDGLNASSSSQAVYIPDGYFKIFNNTIYNSGRFGFVFYNNDGGKKMVMNNLVVKAGQKLTSKGAVLDSVCNIFTQHTASIHFRDTLNSDLRLMEGSPAINNGVDVRAYKTDLTFDYLENPRPQGNAFDVGAYECGKP
mgnify:CR=1 FL=1